MASELVIIERKSGYAVLTLNNPPVNALGAKILTDLDAALDLIRCEDAIKALVIVGSGEKCFSAGANIKEFESPDSVQSNGTQGQAVFLKLEKFPKPIIAAIQGNAFGGGLELSLSCHLRLAAEGISLGLPEVKLGIIPGWGGTQRLTRIAGRTRALEMILTGDPIDAKQALAWGIVNRVCPKESVMSEAESFAEKMAHGPSIAYRAIIRSVIEGADTDIEKGLNIEQQSFQEVFRSSDAKDGISAFLDKRPPRFKCAIGPE